jgi:hypothetical protein
MKNTQAQAIIDTFSNIKGSYESTVLTGVWHAYCDSGIMTDAFSINDVKRINKAKLTAFADENGLQEISNAVNAIDNKGELDCVKCVNAIEALDIDVEEFFELYADNISFSF